VRRSLPAYEPSTTERRRVSNQLHDTLQQTITAASLQLHAASRLAQQDPGEAAAAVSLAQQLLHRGRDEVRDAVWDLRVDDRAQVDLSDLLERLCHESNRQPPARPQLHFAAKAPALLPAHQATQIVRIAREAITNALKNAQAEKLSIHLETNAAGLMLTITDDGQGFDPAATPGPETGHFGLGSMRERAERLGAELRLSSALGQGTTLTLHLPLP
jgi:signal transduction histidine kinase